MEGREVGNYVLEKKLGQGGMGGVWLGRHKSLGTPAAIKVLNVAFGEDAEFRERFSREARTQAQLRHPNIAQVLDHVEQDGRWYLIIEYLDGGTLKDALLEAGGRLDPERAVSWVWQALQGLDYAHQKGIVHRDVKPANILLNERGEAAVTDFGLALALGDQRLTSTGMAVGTPQYMSPEQVEGVDLDHRSDIYSMGAVLYELLCGRVPVELKSTFEIHKVLVQEPEPPVELVPGLDPELARVVMKALAKLPEERFTSCHEFAAALAPFAGDAARSRPSAPPPGIPAAAVVAAPGHVMAPGDTMAPTLATPPPVPPDLPPPDVPPTDLPPALDTAPVSEARPAIAAFAAETEAVSAVRSPSSKPAILAITVIALLGLITLGGVGAGAWWWLTQREPNPPVVTADMGGAAESGFEATDVNGDAAGIGTEGGETTALPPPSEPPPSAASGRSDQESPSAPQTETATVLPTPEPPPQPPPSTNLERIETRTGESREGTKSRKNAARSGPKPRRPRWPPPERPTIAVISTGDPAFGRRLEADLEQRFAGRGLDLFDEGNSLELRDLLQAPGASFSDLVDALEAANVHIVVMIDVEVIGERELYYLGRSSIAAQSLVRLNSFLIPARRPLGEGFSQEVEYTELSATRTAEELSPRLARELGIAIRDTWNSHRRRFGD